MEPEEARQFLVPGTDVFRAWVAAWLDTEGCISIHRREKTATQYRSQYLNLYINQTDPSPLIIIQEYYGGNIYPRKRREKRRLIYELIIPGRKARRLLADVYPYIIVKRKQARLALEFYSLIDRRLAGRKTCGHDPLTDDEWGKRDSIRKQIMSCNRPVVN